MTLTETVNFDQVAKILIQENYILTALELHTELMENGRPLRRLQDYFSNPVNFETPSSSKKPSIMRSSSGVTVDSLEFGTQSDSDVRDASISDARTAVLEFELRKAKETIQSLRVQLTSATEQHPLDPIAAKPGESEALMSAHNDYVQADYSDEMLASSSKPLAHEVRAINYLVHEYLLEGGFKMTAVTLCDECSNQDFDDWDDVGLNVSRPPQLVEMFRRTLHATPGLIRTNDIACQCDDIVGSKSVFNDEVDLQIDMTEFINRLNTENNELMQSNQEITTQYKQLEAELKKVKSENEEYKKCSNQTKIVITAPTADYQKPTLPLCEESDLMEMRDRKPTESLKDLIKERVLEKSISREFVELYQCLNETCEYWKVLSVYLIRVISHVMLDERDDLIAVLSASALHCHDVNLAYTFLHELLNLYKKPDSNRRALIVVACAKYAQQQESNHIQEVLLPILWQELSNKIAERRQLVAQACAAVTPFVPEPLLGSLLLSMLNQLICDERSDHVKCEAVDALAVLCLHIVNADKFNKIAQLVSYAVLDTSEPVRTRSLETLVPVFAQWAIEIDKMTGVFEFYLERASECLKLSPQQINENQFCTIINVCKYLISPLFTTILFDNAELAKSNRNSDRFSDIDIMQYYCDAATSLIEAFDETVNEEWFMSWPKLDRFLKHHLLQLLHITSSLLSTNEKSIDALVQFYKCLVLHFGVQFTRNKITPSIASQLSEDTAGATLPIYCSILLVENASNEKCAMLSIRHTLEEQLNRYASSSSEQQLLVLSVTVRQLYQQCRDRLGILSIFCEAVASDSIEIRLLCVRIVASILPITDFTLIKSRLIPVLITLSSDPNATLRMMVVEPLLHITMMKCDATTFERVRLQLSALFDDQDKDVICALVHTVAQNAPSLDAKTRDTVVLPALVSLSSKAAQEQNVTDKKKILDCLFEAYSSLSCCNVPASALADYFLPGMRHLLNGLDNEHMKIASSILRDAETKISQSLAVDQAPAPADDDMSRRVFSTLRDIKDRMHDNRGFFQRNKL